MASVALLLAGWLMYWVALGDFRRENNLGAAFMMVCGTITITHAVAASAIDSGLLAR